LGVVGQITPYNHPLLIAIKKLAPALAAGNSIVIKPSELAPVSILDFAQMALDAGVPEGVINVVPGYGPVTGKALCESPLLAKLDVTGGTEAGKKIAMAAGQNLITCTAELGGKTPLLVFEDADVNAAVNGAAFAAFVASGQTCVMGSRILVHSSIYKEFVDKLVQKAESLVLGDPLETSTDMGPVISKSQLGKIEEFIQIAKREGAAVLTGGHRWGSSGHYFSPTVIGNCTPDMTIVKEEVFGPVVCVLPFETEQEAIQLTNDSIYGLAAGVWTQDIKKAHRVSHELDVGIVWVNGHHHNDPSSPWGGFKQSGLGKENGIEAFNSYTHLKSTVINYGAPSDWFRKDGVNSRYG
jgi:acyl-CoA reductase-like NAD-dependent aldehyde dehydrogenase